MPKGKCRHARVSVQCGRKISDLRYQISDISRIDSCLRSEI